MIEKLNGIKEEALKEIETCDDEASINNTRSKYLGKKSSFSEVMAGMSELSPEEKKEVGQVSNEVRKEIEDALNKRFIIIKNE